MSTTKSSQPFKLPVRPLENPLTPQDHAGLLELHNRLLVAKDMCYRAQGLVHNIEERIERAEMHLAAHEIIMQRYFPDHLPIPQD